MTEADKTVAELVRQFESIYRDHMQDLPIVNPRLAVEASGFTEYDRGCLGVLITPWFMNLVLLARDAAWSDHAQGDMVTLDFPSGSIDFTICHDNILGTYLTAVLFRSVSDFPDQQTARALAAEVMQGLFVESKNERLVSRRDLLTGRRAT